MGFIILDSTQKNELREKNKMYSLPLVPLVSINEKVSSDYTTSINIYVLENNNGEYIFYTVYHTNDHIKQTVKKDNVVITIDDSVKPFAKVYKETYSVQKYYLTIPNGSIISDRILTTL